MRFRRRKSLIVAFSILSAAILHYGCSEQNKADSSAEEHEENGALQQQICSAGDVEIIDMWLSPADKGGTCGGYCTIRNTGTQPDTLLEVRSAVSSMIQIHEMVDVDDVLTMRELEGPLVIAPGAFFSLKPGGHHIMLMNVANEVPAEASVAVQLHFARAGTIECQAQVKRPGSQKKSSKKAETVQGTDLMGEEVYRRYCMTCHREDGSGIGEIFPPLAGSDFLKDKDRTIDAIVNGLSGPITVNGKEYSGVMSALPGIYDNEQAAAVINYVAKTFGDNSWSVTPSQVDAIRKK